MRIGIDTGGTFTDCVYLRDGEVHVVKVLSTPDDPSLAVMEAIAQTGAESIDLRHGTTVGTNTLLERTGARVAFVTTAGFEDTIAIGRQARADLYNWFAPAPVCMIPAHMRFGVCERVSAEGVMLARPADQEIRDLAKQIASAGAESIAISLLFSFANPETERRLQSALLSLDLPISLSHRILPEFREYERATTTVVNAYLTPRMQGYLNRLERRLSEREGGGRLHVMQSSGGIAPARLAAEEPVRTVLSGPAGGVVAATQVARLAGFERIIGFDMGGTSTDVFLAEAASSGVPLTRESIIAGVPISVPLLEIHTIGAGGGSIARFDPGGMLHVGPESAGADPGPVCYGRGTMPTVTDANLVLGRLDPGSFLAGEVHPDATRAHAFLDQQKGTLFSAQEFAAGILRVVETAMERAVRLISVERGYDPRSFTLVAFGGGGPLHACSLARALRISTVLVPAIPGALSALGVLIAETVRTYSRTVMLPGDAISGVESTFTALEEQAAADFADEGLAFTTERSLDLRYRGQGYELNLPYDSSEPSSALARFHKLHSQQFGFSDPSRPIEIVNVRIRAVAPGKPYSPRSRPLRPDAGVPAHYATRPVYFDDDFLPTQIYSRQALCPGDTVVGPAMVAEYTSATAIPPGCHATVDPFANLIISIPENQP